MNETPQKTPVHANLDAFMKARFRFVNDSIGEKDKVLGIGGGNGMSRDYLSSRSFVDTDVATAPWLDTVCDGVDLPFADGSFDAAVAMAVLHHLSFPRHGLNELGRVVRKGGYICIQEPHASLLLRVMLSSFSHEYIDASVDPYGAESCLPRQLSNMDGNNAIGDLLFKDQDRFEREFSQFKIVHHRFCHFMLYLNSGSLSGEIIHIPLWEGALKAMEWLDDGICKIVPGLFATCQEVVLERI